jgi:murein DD-endopeptidase MepM/ murein hydrolase activator NlpD
LKVQRAYTIVVHGSSAEILRRYRITRRIMIGLLAGTVSLSTFGVISAVVLPFVAVGGWALYGRVERLEVRNQVLAEEKARLQTMADEVGDRLDKFESDSLKLGALAEAAGMRLPVAPQAGGPRSLEQDLAVAVPSAGRAGAADPGLTGLDAYKQLRERAEAVDLRLAQLENLLYEEARRVTTFPSGMPCPGNEGSGFGWRRDPFTGGPDFHQGLDIQAPWGTPILATADGLVLHAAYATGYGLSVYLSHENGIETRFGHMSQMVVREGEAVEAGQVIGYVGSTGRSSGPHLHYETLVDGLRIDPHRFLGARPDASLAGRIRRAD